MRAWSRRNVMAKALAAIRIELAESGAPDGSREGASMGSAAGSRAALAQSGSSTYPDFEGVRIADPATLLAVDANLLRKGQVIGLREFVQSRSKERPCSRWGLCSSDNWQEACRSSNWVEFPS